MINQWLTDRIWLYRKGEIARAWMIIAGAEDREEGSAGRTEDRMVARRAVLVESKVIEGDRVAIDQEVEAGNSEASEVVGPPCRQQEIEVLRVAAIGLLRDAEKSLRAKAGALLHPQRKKRTDDRGFYPEI